VGVEVDGRLCGLIDDERVAVERNERGRQHRPNELPHGIAQRAVAGGKVVSELARHALGPQRFGPGHGGGIEHEGGCPAGRELRNTSERVGIGERAFERSVDDRVELAQFVAAGVADGALALGVGPAGDVGDQLAVVVDEQVGILRIFATCSPRRGLRPSFQGRS